MTTFADLAFEPHPNHPLGTRAVVFFPNGYGASIIRSRSSYGGRDGFFELAVLAGLDDLNSELCYDTPITDDVLGWLTEENVTETLALIEALPARSSA